MPTYYPRAWAVMRVYFDDFTGEGSKSIEIETVPSEMTVHLNGYRQADTFDLSFDARHLPMTPELIRAIGVSLYLFQIEKNDDGTAVGGVHILAFAAEVFERFDTVAHMSDFVEQLAAGQGGQGELRVLGAVFNEKNGSEIPHEWPLTESGMEK